MIQVLIGQSATLRLDTGTGTSQGEMTVDVTDAAGASVVDDGAANDAEDGTYTYTLAGQDEAKLLRVEWSGGWVTYVEVVSNVLFTLAEARAAKFTGAGAALSSDTAYPDAEIARVRTLIRDQFEDRTGLAWASRYCRTELSGNDAYRLALHRGRNRDIDGRPVGGPGAGRPTRLISVTVNDDPVDLDSVYVDGSHLVRPSLTWPSSPSNPFNVVVEYEYGPDPVPAEAHEQALRTAVSTLVPSDVSGFAQSFNSQDGVVNFGTGGLVYPSRTWEWLKKHQRVFVG